MTFEPGQEVLLKGRVLRVKGGRVSVQVEAGKSLVTTTEADLERTTQALAKQSHVPARTTAVKGPRDAYKGSDGS